MDAKSAEMQQIVEAMLKTGALLRDADVAFALGGSVGCWARGGPETVKDLDFIVAPSDAEAGINALEEAGMRCEQPPHGWLYKAWEGDVLVDLIFGLTGIDDVAGVVERAQTMRVSAMELPVARVEDILTPKLLAFDEHNLDFSGPLAISRALREQIDWHDLRERTGHSPYAVAFFKLVEGLEIAPPAGEEPAASPAGPSVRVVR